MRFQLRTDPAQPALAGTTLIDIFNGPAGSTVRNSVPEFFKDLVVPSAALDLFHLGVAVYCADRVDPRSSTADAWTRDISLTVPVDATVGWASAVDALTRALDFLTGDRWTLRLTPRDPPEESIAQLDLLPPDAVCLFSGGLDSLSGAIDLLDADQRVILVGHHENGQAPRRQTDLAEALAAKHGVGSVKLRQLFLAPSGPKRGQLRPLPQSRENTTRGRSFLFLSAGFAVAAALGQSVPLFIPENGLIGINVPLTGSRPGSLSTRTTHPYFIHLMEEVRSAIGLTVELKNPYRLSTKGEMLASSKNRRLLRVLAPRSVSCAHPEAARWTKNPRRPQGNCGYCYPCLIRRASLHHASLPGGSYAYDLKTDYKLIAETGKGASLRALLRSLSSPARPTDVLRTGPIPNGEAPEFADVYARGREELLTWLQADGGRQIRRRLP